MNNVNYLKEIINGRTCAVLAHGASIETLENYIINFKDKDICWTSLNLFPVMERFILSNINKNLDIVFDCSTVVADRDQEFELRARFPRLQRYLARFEKNLWITTHGLIRDSIKPFEPAFGLESYESKILMVDTLFPEENRGYWMSVPNSVALFIGALIAGGAKKIVLFGMDGYNGPANQDLNTYYKPEYQAVDRMLVYGNLGDPGLIRDTLGWIERFPPRLEEYYKLFNRFVPVYNCSPGTLYSVPQKIHYHQLEDIF